MLLSHLWKSGNLGKSKSLQEYLASALNIELWKKGSLAPKLLLGHTEQSHCVYGTTFNKKGATEQKWGWSGMREGVPPRVDFSAHFSKIKISTF